MSALPDQDVSKAETDALEEFARELANKISANSAPVSTEKIISNIRWYPNKAGAVVIVSRGKNRNVLATISPKSGKWSHLYPSWEPVLAELNARKIAANVSRMSHDGIEAGSVPQ